MPSPVSSLIKAGITGMMRPNPVMSIIKVIKINPIAAVPLFAIKMLRPQSSGIYRGGGFFVSMIYWQSLPKNVSTVFEGIFSRKSLLMHDSYFITQCFLGGDDHGSSNVAI
jgi:hypothetical protein